MKSALKLLTICVFSILASACTLQRMGTGPDPVSWNVAPPYFCPGDPVTVSWNFSSMRKDPANCSPPNGGFGSLIACISNADCPGGSADTGTICIDSYCCRRDLYDTPGKLMCATDRGCYPAFDITITADTLTLDPPVDSESVFVSGYRTVTPDATTAFTIRGGYASRPAFLFEDGKTATIVRPTPPTSAQLDFIFECARTTPGWPTFDFDSEPMATEHVRIARVRNVGSHIINVQRTGSEPVTLHPGAVTETLNGKVDGKWNASLASFDPAFLSRPRCEPTEIINPWPNLFVELTFICVAD